MKQLGFFDVEERLARLSGLGDQLEAFGGIEEPLIDVLGSRFKAFGDLIDGFWGRF
ncbi:hypothetical protein [Gluconobacter sp. DsW_058]|uniref:hypothetical protein n=1 Tax=Gluconobacter sp. DsW_058 TaxID=1511210 RepID=UPI0013025627|nr:hypothetical protein [Gluconobacter sp. DsW_058]